MAKKIVLELTEAQFRALIDIVDTMSGTLGEGGDYTKYQLRNIKLFDRMLKKNGYKRMYN